MSCQWKSAISGAVWRKRSYLLLLHGGAGGRQAPGETRQWSPITNNHHSNQGLIEVALQLPSWVELCFPPSSTPLFFLLRNLLHLFKRALTRTRPVSYNRSRREGSERWNSVSKLTSSQVSLRLRVKGDFWRNGKKIVMRFQMAISLLTTLKNQGSLRSFEVFRRYWTSDKLSICPRFPWCPLLIRISWKPVGLCDLTIYIGWTK